MNAIMLGNLTPEEFGKRMNLELSEETLKFMNEHRCLKADVPAGTMQLHIFDIPLQVHCGCIEMAQKFADHMRNNYDLSSNGRSCQVSYS
jgi:hypothetical protein